MPSCERIISDDYEVCGAPEVDRLWHLNERMDHPGPSLGLGLCTAHLDGYLRESLFQADPLPAWA